MMFQSLHINLKLILREYRTRGGEKGSTKIRSKFYWFCTKWKCNFVKNKYFPILKCETYVKLCSEQLYLIGGSGLPCKKNGLSIC